jgi:glycine/D-amino acid oxidase-like deaminating enzyme
MRRWSAAEARPQRVEWIARMLGNCTTAAYARNKSRMVRLAEYSRDCLIALRADTGIAYDERTQGTLQLFRTEQVAAAEKDIAVLRADGVPFEVLDRAGCLAAEPGLAGAPTASQAGCACRGMRPATASSSPTRWPTWRRRWASPSAGAWRSTGWWNARAASPG